MAFFDTANKLEEGLEPLEVTPDILLPERPTTNTGTDGTLAANPLTQGDRRLRFSSLLYAPKSLLRLRNKNSGSPLRMHNRMALPKVRRPQDFPCGFPRLACFLDSDDSFMVYRIFGTVFSRLLLHEQDEMRQLEAALDSMDKVDEHHGHAQYLMSPELDAERQSFPDEWPGQSRPQLMETLKKKALDYAELILKVQQLKTLGQPSARDHRSVLHFLGNEGGQTYEKEMSFINKKEDLVTLRPEREYAWLDSLVEQALRMLRCRFTIFLFSSKGKRDKIGDSSIHYYDRGRITTFVTFLITIVILVLLLVPIWLLYQYSIANSIATSLDKMGIISVTTLLFSAMLSAFTKAKRHEILGASSGYCAVLVIFLGNVNNYSVG
ncbi:hypothetical protein MMC17_007209 [Xylographa soralifera]|nr:hypothetical protein [Xylographa soralifera]